jgi:uroporphyrinogen-III synthase
LYSAEALLHPTGVSSTGECMERGAKQLVGHRILVGRARHQAGALASSLRERGAEVLEIPFIEIRPPRSFQSLDTALRKLAEYEWLILTSVNGVDAMSERLKKLGIDNQQLAHLQIAAIGPATRKRIEKRGLTVDVVPKEYVAESVVESLREKVAGRRILLVRAKVARDVIPRELRKVADRVDVVEAYETVVPRASAGQLRSVLKDSERRPDVITFTSSSTVRNFVALLESGKGSQGHLRHTGLLDGIKLASIGPVTSGTLRELGLPVDIEAREYTIPGLVQAIAAAMAT